MQLACPAAQDVGEPQIRPGGFDDVGGRSPAIDVQTAFHGVVRVPERRQRRGAFEVASQLFDR